MIRLFIKLTKVWLIFALPKFLLFLGDSMLHKLLIAVLLFEFANKGWVPNEGIINPLDK
jgi:hypothetical protein